MMSPPRSGALSSDFRLSTFALLLRRVAKDAEDAKKAIRRVAKAAKAAKESIIRTKPEGREGTAPRVPSAAHHWICRARKKSKKCGRFH